jgi:hypothetical protein
VAQVGAVFEQDTADAFAAAALNRRHSWLEHSDAAFQLALALVGASAKSKDLSAALEHLGKGCIAAVDGVAKVEIWSCVTLVLGFSDASVPCRELLRRVADAALLRPLELPSTRIVAIVRAFSKLNGAADQSDLVRVERLAATCLLRFREMDVQDFSILIAAKNVTSISALRKLLLQYLCSVMPTIPVHVFSRMVEEFVSIADSISVDALWQQLYALLQNRKSLQWSVSDLASICLALNACSARVSNADYVTSFALACAQFVADEVHLCSDSSLCRYVPNCLTLLVFIFCVAVQSPSAIH